MYSKMNLDTKESLANTVTTEVIFQRRGAGVNIPVLPPDYKAFQEQYELYEPRWETYAVNYEVKVEEDFAMDIRHVFIRITEQEKHIWLRHKLSNEVLYSVDSEIIAHQLARMVKDEVSKEFPDLEYPKEVWRYLENLIRAGLDTQYRSVLR